MKVFVFYSSIKLTKFQNSGMICARSLNTYDNQDNECADMQLAVRENNFCFKTWQVLNIMKLDALALRFPSKRKPTNHIFPV
jgi:hypothetical protein